MTFWAYMLSLQAGAPVFDAAGIKMYPVHFTGKHFKARNQFSLNYY